MPNILTNPLIPEAPVRKLQEQMTTPHLDESPLWAQVKGFGAGALEGLRGQTSPLNIASNLAMLIPGAGFARGGAALAEAPQAAKGAGAMAGLLDAIPAAEFAPVGGEAAYNAARPALQKLADPAAAAYERLLPTVGQAGKVEHNSQAIADIARPGTQQMIEKLHAEANPTFRRLQEAGAFSGERYR